MKTIIIIATILAVIATITGCILCCAHTNNLTSNGHMTQRTILLDPFTKIDATRGVEVVLVEGSTLTATIEADDNIIDKVIVRVDENELKITLDPMIHTLSAGSVKVTVPTDGHLSKIEAGSGAKIIGKTTLQAPQIEFEASSAGNIDAEVNTENCEIEISSAAKITLRGKAYSCKADINSAAKLNASEFIVANYTVEVSSAGKASIHCTESICAEASSAGSIIQTGSGIGMTKSSSGGSIRKR